MGMFDYINCEMLTLDGKDISIKLDESKGIYENSNYLYQTKSTRCDLDTLLINSDGRLIRESKCGYDGVGSDTTDCPEDLNFHGDIEFYGGIDDYEKFLSYYYIARFYNGQCVGIIPRRVWEAMGGMANFRYEGE